MAKFGEKNRTFVVKATAIAAQNPDILPRSFNLDEMMADVSIIEDLYPLIATAANLPGKLEDTYFAASPPAAKPIPPHCWSTNMPRPPMSPLACWKTPSTTSAIVSSNTLKHPSATPDSARFANAEGWRINVIPAGMPESRVQGCPQVAYKQVARMEPPCGAIRGVPRKTRIAPQGGSIRATAFSKGGDAFPLVQTKLCVTSIF